MIERSVNEENNDCKNIQKTITSCVTNNQEITEVDIPNLSLSHKQVNNNRYIVPIGVIWVSFNLYLTALLLHKGCQSCFTIEYFQTKVNIPSDEHLSKNHVSLITTNLDHKNRLVCTTMNLLSPSDLNSNQGNQDTCPVLPIRTKENSNHGYPAKKIINTCKSNKHIHRKYHMRRKLDNSSKNISKKSSLKKKSQKPIKRERKTIVQVKKTSTEPVIYVFAIVFIYLLIKAATDISNHYKLQGKGDKHLRRYSLQSYAQAHKQDRRISKGITTKNLPKFH